MLRKLQKTFLFFGIVTLTHVEARSNHSAIPSREEQANLLLNVQEVLEQITLLVKHEAGSTDTSVVKDIKMMVNRAKDKLSLLEELALIKISCGAQNPSCLPKANISIQKIVREGEEAVKLCTNIASDEITLSSSKLSNVTESATSRGQGFLSSLEKCSRKVGLGVISCYRSIILTDVLPVKLMLLGAIEEHKAGHLRTISIRDQANECVDNVITKYREKINGVLAKTLQCSEPSNVQVNNL